VVILPRRGTLVADLNESDLDRIYEMRSVLEGEAARRRAHLARLAVLTRLVEVRARDRAELQRVSLDACAWVLRRGAGEDYANR
jgi:DNA-binding GntR family transcriptional regulator